MSESYSQRVAEVAEDAARDVDELANEIWLPGALPRETWSHHVARLEVANNRFGCFMCAALSRLVQRDHCRVTLDGGAMPSSVYWRAGVCFGLLFLASPLWAPVVAAVEVGRWLVGRLRSKA